MPQSLSKVYSHLTFSTKKRFPFIENDIKSRLFDYLGGICKEEFRAFLKKYNVEYDERYVWD